MRACSVFVCVLLAGVTGLSATAQVQIDTVSGQVIADRPAVTAPGSGPGPLRGEFLVDNGSVPGGGWSVSGWEQEYAFTQFQALTVGDAEGWNVTTIGIDGNSWDDPDGMGIIGTLLPDIDGEPDEDHPVASATYFLSDDPFHSNWRDEEFNIALAQGSYWFRIAAGGPHLEAMIFDGVSGEGAFTRRGDGLETQHGPLAFRVAGTVSEPCPGDLNGDGYTDLSDLGILLATYNKCPGDEGYNPIANLNDDDGTGCINLADLGVLLADYGCGT
jgi:hypothetical protein